jgi:hypothetical protein
MWRQAKLAVTKNLNLRLAAAGGARGLMIDCARRAILLL